MAASLKQQPAPRKAAPATKTTNTAKAADLRGGSKILVDAVVGVTDIVEEMHRQISRVAPVVGKPREGRTSGITGFVYRSVRGITRAVGFGLDKALAQLAPLLRSGKSSPQREAVLATLNGVLGDYLEQTGNPLAITMRFRYQGNPLTLNRESIAEAIAQPGGKLLVLVHGLCMNDLQWTREGQDHGAALAKDLGYTPLYLHYNTGRPIAVNGREFAESLEQLIAEWPVAVRDLVIVGHSMGGLVSRSACHHAGQARHSWPKKLKKVIFLGTPHHGAPLERAGNGLDMLLGVSPYSAPFAKLGKVRSAGIKDLRHGHLLDSKETVPLPTNVKCYAIAATKQVQSTSEGRRLQGDGLVPVNSALGWHKDAQKALAFPQLRRHVCFATDHFQLLSSREAYEKIRSWLSAR
jgi:pimeloyl-ACP methyl ester carboxylesterase